MSLPYEHKQFIIHVISHTHWDREWFLPFSGFRNKLVKAIDRLFVILERNPSYIFHLDGQVIPLEDYLEVKPTKESLLRKYVQERRLIIGPWYVMPDEFLVSPESLYRNLKLGMSYGHRFGPVMKVGYLPDPFGHIRQMWQILNKFGIESAVIWRGMPGAPETIRNEVYLTSPDGSKVLGAYLPHGYTNARALGTSNRLSSWLCQRLMPLLKRLTYPGMSPNGLRDYIYYFVHYLAAFKITHLIDAIEDGALRSQVVSVQGEALKGFATTNHLLFLNGGDHQYPREDITRAIAEANRENPSFHLQPDTMENYFSAIRQGQDDWPVISAELRSSHYAPVLSGVLSSRMYIKQANHRVEDLLEKWSYPWASLAHVTANQAYPQATLEEASQWLLKNHPHDSICGTSVGQVYRDMMARFKKARSLADEVLQNSLEAIAKTVDTSSIDSDEHGLLVFNSSGWVRTEVVGFTPESNDVDNQLTARDSDSNLIKSQASWHQHQHKTLLLAEDIPPLGYKLFRLKTGLTLQPAALPIGTEQTLENEHLVVKIEEDGSFRLTHKPSGQNFGPLGYFEDSGDSGDTYNYAPPDEDRVITSRGGKARVSLVENGPVQATARVDLTLLLPKKLDIRAKRRVQQKVAYNITSLITLRAGSPVVNIRTELDNKAKDHRLRILFPTGIKTNVCNADGHWDVIERPIVPEPELDKKTIEVTGKVFNLLSGEESPSLTHPQRRFIDVSDGIIGLAAINNGLPEYEVKNDTERTIALTLLRCIGWLSRTSVGTRRGFAGPILRVSDAQCLGRHTFEYALMPHLGNWEQSLVYMEAENHNVPCRVLQISAPGGSMPPVHSFVSVSPPCLVLSSLESSKNGNLLIRLYNISHKPVTGEIKFGFNIKEANIVDFNEQVIQTLKIVDKSITLTVEAKEMVMLSLAL